MPLDFDQGLTQIGQSRQSRRQQEARLVENRNDLSRREAELDVLVRAGASEAEIRSAETKLADAQAERRSLLDAVADADASIAGIVGQMVAGVPEMDLFKQMKATVPIALLPVRLETRFFLNDPVDQLCIRIYPDQVHIDNHFLELLPEEHRLGKEYWRIHRQGDGEALRAAWIRLGQQFTPTRAAWIVHVLTPADPDSGSSEPDFPDVAIGDDGTIHVPRARLLPERWVALGFARDAATASYVPLFTKWGATVPDSLSVGLSFDVLAEPVETENAEEDTLPINPEVLWTVDYKAAQRVGMAITVAEDSDLPQGKKLKDGVDLLVVLGVDWTFAPDEGAGKLAEVFIAHQYSDGMAFVPQGTPTNNTGPARSGFTTDPVALASAIDPEAESTPDAEDHAAQRMTEGLGLARQDTLGRVPNAGLHEQAVASTMIDALWEGTLGYYLDELMDPLVSDAFIDRARDHAAGFLQPFGPYAAFRVGKQPYGLLPVLSLDRFEPDRENEVEVEETLANLLRELIGFWRAGLDMVHFMGKNDDPDTDLLALLQQNPLSVAKRFRLAFDTETTTNTKGGAAFARIQSDLRRAFFFELLAKTVEARIAATKLAQMDPQATHYPLFGPWVQAGDLETDDPLKPNYIQKVITDVRGGAEGRIRLHKRTKSRVLLEALLAYSALRELDRAGSKALDEHLFTTKQLPARPSKSTLTTRSLTGIDSAVAAPQADHVLIETPEQQAALAIVGLTRGLPLSEFLSQEVNKPETPVFLRNLKTFIASLEQLVSCPAREIDRCFRAVLDAYSYRLDAWLTSLASRRLQRIRKTCPVGLYVGGYGWVENLRPDIGQQDSLGYIHTPSIAHATAAAIMRSGHLSHRGPQNSRTVVKPGTAESVFSIDLSSKRVRQALTLLDGVAQGQSLAELLGYRFERQLRDHDFKLMKFVRPLRKIAPLRSTVPDASSASAEDIAVRDVVDGVKLLEEWRKAGRKLFSRIKEPAPDSGERDALMEELKRLDEMFDAVSDLLVAEGVYQSVRGNYERAGAALSALDRQSQPPEPQFVRTPRSGLSYQQRVLVLVQDDRLPAPWVDLPGDLRAELEPRLNAWIAKLLGDPNRFELVAQVRDGDVAQDPMTAPLRDFLIDAKLSPLSLVLMSAAADPQGPSELELVLARFFARKVDDPAESMTLELMEEPQSAGQDLMGFGAFQALLQMIHRVVARPRSAGTGDLIPAGSDEDPVEVEQNLANQVEDLKNRLDIVHNALKSTIGDLQSAIRDSQPEPLRDALLKAFHLALPDAYPKIKKFDAEEARVLAEQAAPALDALQRKQTELAAKEQRFKDWLAKREEASKLSEAEKLHLMSDHLVQQIGTLIGESVPVLPTFSLSNAQELAASRRDRNALIDDELAPIAWLQQVAMVRPLIQELVSALTASEMLGTPIDPDEFQIMQLPHRPGQTWTALTLPGPDGGPNLALLTIGQFDPGKPLAGIVCDGWTEVIPARDEMTGLSFHYDAPASRAPQSIVLVVPPSLEQENWDFESVRDSVLATFELAKLRAVGPKELPELGSQALPMLYIPQDRTKQRPSIDLRGIAERWEAAAGEILGKMNSHAP
jgi:hypothetical protein